MDLGSGYSRRAAGAVSFGHGVPLPRFSATRWTQQILHGLLGASASDFQDSGEFPDLGLSSRQRADLEARLGSAALQEFFFLRGEDSAELYWEAVLGIAGRLESAGRYEVAANLYHLALRDGEGTLPPRLSRAASRRLDALMGRGELGSRWELTTRQFASEATNPSALVGMGVAATVFSFSRLALLSRLWTAPTASFFTRGFGSRVLASGLALVPETGAFWLSSKGISELMGPGSQDWSLRRNYSELRSLALGLGAMRASGFVFQRLHLGLRGPISTASANGAASLERAALHQFAMFGGILASHGLEQNLGWVPPRTLGDTVLSSLATLLHFNVAGRLSATAFPGLYRMQREAEVRLLRQESLPFQSWGSDRSGGGRFSMPESILVAGVGRLSPTRVRTIAPFADFLVFMSSNNSVKGDSVSPGPRRSSSSSSWNFGSIAPPAPEAGPAVEPHGEAIAWLNRAIQGEAGLSPLHRVMQWYDFGERQKIMEAVLETHAPIRVLSALEGRVGPAQERAERLTAIGLMHLLAAQVPSAYPEVQAAMRRAAGRFPLDPQTFAAWQIASSEIRAHSEGDPTTPFDHSRFVDAILRARRDLDRLGHPHPLINEISDALPGLPMDPPRFRKYSLLTLQELSRNTRISEDVFGDYLQGLFLSERAALAGEWVMSREVLRKTRDRIRQRGGEGTVRVLEDLDIRERAMLDLLSDFIAVEDAPRNPFLRFDPRRHFSTVTLLRRLNASHRESLERGVSMRAEFLSRYSAEIFERDMVSQWLESIPEAEIRNVGEPLFRQISEFLRERSPENAPYWPTLLSQISETLLASSRPEQAFQTLKDIYGMDFVPLEAFYDALISQVTAVEILMHQTRDSARSQALRRTRDLFSAWSASL